MHADIRLEPIIYLKLFRLEIIYLNEYLSIILNTYYIFNSIDFTELNLRKKKKRTTNKY